MWCYRFRNGFKFALRWLPCIKWSTSDAHGFWGFMSVRNASVGDPQTRCSYALVGGGPTTYGIPLADRGGRNGGGGARQQQQRQQPLNYAGSEQSSSGARLSLMAAKRKAEQQQAGTAGGEFQYKYANGRFDSC